MKKFTVLFMLSVFLFAGNYSFSQENIIGSIVTDDLKEQMNQNKTNDLIRVNIRLVSQYDTQNLNEKMKFLGREARRIMVVNELKNFSEKTQKGVLTFLENQEKVNEAKIIYKLWINNVITCMVSNDVIYTLSHRNDIDRIDWDEKRKMIIGSEKKPGDESEDKGDSKEITWNVTKVNADDVWAQGFTGAGVIVGVLDTGVNYNHDDLDDHMWTDPGYLNHGYDFVNGDNDPMDDHGHGTHCAGTVAGDGTSGSQTGMAPDAKIMALKILASDGSGDESGVWSAIQFAIDNDADVISMSIGWLHAWGPDRQSWRNAHYNALVAGLVASVAAGNEGTQTGSYPVPDNVRTPGDCPPPWLHPDQQALTGGLSNVVCVGATNSSDGIASFSAYGPVTWSSISPYSDYPWVDGSTTNIGLIRPDISAPGDVIKSLDYSGTTGYTTMSGTSMATPCVAGVMALMFQKNSALTPAQIDEILETTAVELGVAGKDDRFGSGRIDALAAINAVTNPTLTANFMADDLTPSVGQTVNFTDQSSGPNTITSWAWTFQGGTPPSSSIQNPTVTYNTAGTFDVSLTVGDGSSFDDEPKGGYISAAYSASATYTSGDIQTDYDFDLPTENSSCPGNLTVAIPAGAIVTGVDVEYDMTASSSENAWMSEQRSELRCVSSGGANEGTVYEGSGSSAGTYSYGRTGLSIANGVTGGGNINFELHAGRTWGGSGCNTTFNKVDNNTWTVTIYYTSGTPTPPSCTTPSSPTDGETDVAITTDLVWNSAGSATGYYLYFGTNNPPTNIVNGTNQGNTTTYSPAGSLNSNTTYYWKVVPFNSEGSATGCDVWDFYTAAPPAPCNSIPYTQDFENGGAWPTDWSTDNSNVWSLSTTWNGANNPGGYNVFSDYTPYETGTVYAPCFDGSTISNIYVKFYHYWRADYSSGTQDGYFYGSRDGGNTYPYLIDEWHHNNPATEEEEKIYDISSWADGYDNITFKWEVSHNNDWYWQFDNFEIYTQVPGLWTGSTSTDWGVTTNWDDSNVPVAGTDVTIPSSPSGGNFPETNTGAGAACNNLTIGAGAHLFIPSNNTLTVNGTLTNNAGNAGLVVKSDAAGTGSLIHNTTGVNGTVERYLTDMEWHFIGIPVGSATAGVFHFPSGHSDIYLRTHAEATNTWSEYIVPLNTPLVLGRGYDTWVGDPAGIQQPETVEFTGALNTDNYTTGIGGFYDLEYTTSGLNLISNPYPSALLADIDNWAKNNVDNSVWIWDHAAGNYVYWNGNSGTMTGGIIPSMQAFFVIANGSNPDVTIPQANRVHSNQPFYKDSYIPDNTLKLEVSGNEYKDIAFVTFSQVETDEYDGLYDVKKIYGLNEAPQLYSIIPGDKLSINALSEFIDYRLVNLGFECETPAMFTIEASEIQSFEESITIYLEDLKTGSIQNLNESPVYEFAHEIGDESGRFILHFGEPNAVEELDQNNIRIYSNKDVVYINHPVNLNGDIIIYDLMGQEIARKNPEGKSLTTITINNGTGYYLVKIINEKDAVAKKVFIK